MQALPAPLVALGAIAAGGGQTADHFAVRNVDQGVEMQASVFLAVFKAIPRNSDGTNAPPEILPDDTKFRRR